MDELDKKAEKGLEAFGKKDDLEAVKSTLDSMVDGLLDDEDDSKGGQKSAFSPIRWLMIFIILVLVAGMAYLGYRDGSASKSQKDTTVLYAQYFEVLPNSTTATTRGLESEEGVEDAFRRGIALYNQGKYSEAVDLLQSSEDLESLLFAAIANMQLGESKRALDLLQKVEKKQEAGAYKDIIQWYTSLCHLKANDTAKARSILSTIANSNHYKSKEASEILSVLK